MQKDSKGITESSVLVSMPFEPVSCATSELSSPRVLHGWLDQSNGRKLQRFSQTVVPAYFGLPRP